eukprot:5244633-Prymnesium_polylepis.1
MFASGGVHPICCCQAATTCEIGEPGTLSAESMDAARAQCDDAFHEATNQFVSSVLGFLASDEDETGEEPIKALVESVCALCKRDSLHIAAHGAGPESSIEHRDLLDVFTEDGHIIRRRHHSILQHLFLRLVEYDSAVGLQALFASLAASSSAQAASDWFCVPEMLGSDGPAVFAAITKGSVRLVDTLIQLVGAAAVANTRSRSGGQTALQAVLLSASNHLMDVLGLLLEHGADVDGMQPTWEELAAASHASIPQLWALLSKYSKVPLTGGLRLRMLLMDAISRADHDAFAEVLAVQTIQWDEQGGSNTNRVCLYELLEELASGALDAPHLWSAFISSGLFVADGLLPDGSSFLHKASTANLPLTVAELLKGGYTCRLQCARTGDTALHAAARAAALSVVNVLLASHDAAAYIATKNGS